jgi:hypothetical protein
MLKRYTNNINITVIILRIRNIYLSFSALLSMAARFAKSLASPAGAPAPAPAGVSVFSAAELDRGPAAVLY